MKKILTVLIILLSLVVIAYAADLFSDGFESGDLTAWDGSVTDSGDLSAHADAALHGSYGLKCVVDDNVDIHVLDATPNAETRYRTRFYFDPNSFTSTDCYIVLLHAWTEGYGETFWVCYHQEGSTRGIYAQDATDAQDYSRQTSTYTITDEPHYIEVDWKASTGAGNNDGYLKLYIDGVLKETIGSLDNDTTSVGAIWFGFEYVWWADGSGIIYLDDFASNDDGTEIGEISEGWSMTWDSATITSWNDSEISKWNGVE